MMLIREVTAFTNIQQCGLSQPDPGQGLNPLLQNYWMTIHPPLFSQLFALTVVPFGYAIAAALRKNSFEGWLRPVLPWALFGTAILGISLTMGSLWAYEALSFGGYWAWDPCRKYIVGAMDRAGRWHTHQPYCQSHRQGHQINPTFLPLGAF